MTIRLKGEREMIANKLKKIRMGEHEMSKRDFANFLEIGVTEMQYSRYEKATQQPPLETALKISNKLRKTVNEIWNIVDED